MGDRLPLRVERTAAERRLCALLRLLVFAFAAAAVLYAAGALLGPTREFFRQLPFVSNSVVKVAVMGLLCLFAAADIRRRHGLVLVFMLGHALSVAAMLAVLFPGDVGGEAVLFGRTIAVRTVLWSAVALDGAITLLVLLFYLPARAARRAVTAAAAAGPAPSPAELAAPGAAGAAELLGAEKRVRFALAAFGVVFLLAGIAYELGPFLASTRAFFVELPFVTNSVVKVGTLGLLCLYIARDLRARLPLAGIVIGAHVVSGLAQGMFLLLLDTGFTVEVLGRTLTMRALLLGSIALDAGIAVLLFVLCQAAWNARLRPRFLRPTEYRALVALADVLVRGPDEKVTPLEVTANVDAYVSRVRAKRRWVYRVALFALQLHPVLYVRAPLSELDEEQRLRHLKKHFHRDVIRRALPEVWRRFVQGFIRIAKQLAYVGYYADTRTHASIGYVPFSARARAKQLQLPPRAPHPLRVETPPQIDADVLESDVCIVGSGAGGAILAYELARAGRDVLVVERGRYVEPREFGEDEVEMIGKLYADGIFQQTQDYRFTVLQGSCVGGSTTVNNAVCFDPPAHVLARWNDPRQRHAGLELDGLAASVAAVRRFLRIQPQAGAPLNPSYPKFLAGAEEFRDGLLRAGLEAPRLDTGVVDANIEGCLGCGYCNTGCAYGKKLSMLDTALPWAQRDFPGRVRVVAECEVERIRTLSGSTRRVLDLAGRLSDGRKLRLRARTYVLSAGAIASSWLLMRSGVGRGLPVGKGLCFNMGAPLTAEFDEPLDAYDGLQISHFGVPDPERGFVYETWWNPPVSQAINMPGWFEEHYENMRRYRHLMAVGVLVGTQRNARITPALTGGPDIAYVPERGDLVKLADGLKQLGYMLFAAGAKRVLVNAWGTESYSTPDDLARLDRIALDPSYITLGTGHPQGGNAISVDPQRGVVGPDFRVHGYSNLYVCDASVIPSSLTVNPQLTIMALAHYASSRIR